MVHPGQVDAIGTEFTADNVGLGRIKGLLILPPGRGADEPLIIDVHQLTPDDDRQRRIDLPGQLQSIGLEFAGSLMAGYWVLPFRLRVGVATLK